MANVIHPIGTTIPSHSFRGSGAVARRDITPPVGIRNRNWGPAESDVSAGTHRELTLTAIALVGDEQTPLLLLSIDATWWRSGEDEWRLRSSVLDALGLSTDQVLISLSHTHAGAVLCAGDSELDGGEYIPDYLAHISEQAISAGREALDGLQPVTLDWTTGSCTVAADRELAVEGRTVVGYNPSAVADDTVVIGRLSAANGGAIATLVNYACHPTTLAWQNRLISPDYVGAMREVVERETGAPCAFVQGASGDLAPKEQYVGDVSVADRHGYALGYSVMAALSSLPDPGNSLTLTAIIESGAPLGIWETKPAPSNGSLRSLEMPVELVARRMPTMAELEKRWAHIEETSRNERLLRAKHVIEEYKGDGPISHPVWAWQIGDGLLVAHPGEAFSAFQKNLRSRYPDRTVVVMNLTNGPGSRYLPPDEAYQRKAYASWASTVAAGSLERLEHHAADLFDQLVAADSAT